MARLGVRDRLLLHRAVAADAVGQREQFDGGVVRDRREMAERGVDVFPVVGDQLALELARYGITVNAIQPGPFQTRITTPELLAPFLASAPTHRIGQPHEIEGVALFLASNSSGFVTGAQYTIDGGQLLGRAD